MIGRLLRLDLMTFVTAAASLDQWDPDFGRGVDAAFRMAVCRRFDESSSTADIVEFVAKTRLALGPGGVDLDPGLSEALLADAAGLTGLSHPGADAETTVRTKVVLISSIVAQLSLEEADITELVGRVGG
ncbi:hypothetical protein [Frankia sp. Cppng1_Ct_nod]|uniref:hypothetical protein n=1 Tax=Frankia sp. Cppng1_Ct_nod TaxID=2897162 RepID=UPI001040EBD6|nr:hypothetical protein [Frankia sp. Cppng1_Ct_nod]